MRQDMQFVLIERPRAGTHYGKQPKGSRKQLYNQFKELDDIKKESIRKPWILSLEDKQFNDLLGPLAKFLRSKIGCLWNDVYSEIRKNISPKSKLQLHLLEHVFDFVEVNVTIVNSQILDERFYPLYPYKKRIRFYVCPESGILKQIPEQKIEISQDKKILWYDKEKLQQYHQIKGIWYIVQLKTYSQEIMHHDVLLKKILYFSPYNAEYGGYYYAISKKQLNKKEIKVLRNQYEY